MGAVRDFIKSKENAKPIGLFTKTYEQMMEDINKQVKPRKHTKKAKPYIPFSEE